MNKKKMRTDYAYYEAGYSESYHHQPLVNPALIKKEDLGLEIELASKYSHREMFEIFNGIDWNGQKLTNYVYISSDATIVVRPDFDGFRHRVELAFAPAPITEQVDRVKKVHELLKGKSRAYNRGGIHVTVPKEACGENSTVTFGRMAYLLSKFDEDTPLYSEFFGRKPTTYCSKHASIQVSSDELVTATLLNLKFNTIRPSFSVQQSGSKPAVKLRTHGGLEIRLFNSNLDSRKVERYLTVSTALTEFCKKVNDIEKYTDEGFEQFISSYSRKYTILNTNQ